MKRSFGILLSVGVLTFTFIQCKTSHPEAKSPTSKPTTSTASSTTPAIPLVNSPEEAAQATINASQAFINSPDPCIGLDASTCNTLKDAATQTASTNPKFLSSQLNAQNLIDASSSATQTPTDSLLNTETDFGTNLATTTNTKNSDHSSKAVLGVGISLLLVGTIAAIGLTYHAFKTAQKTEYTPLARDELISKMIDHSQLRFRVDGKITRYIQIKGNGMDYTISKDSDGKLVVDEWVNFNHVRTLNKAETEQTLSIYQSHPDYKQAEKESKPLLDFGSTKWVKAGGLIAALSGGLIATIVGSLQLAEDTGTPPPAWIFANTLTSIGDQVVNGYQH